MESIHINDSVAVLLLGGIVVICVFLYARTRAVGVPSLFAFVLLGLALQIVDGWSSFLSQGLLEVLNVLGKIGVIALLFRIGLESDLRGLLGKVRQASLIWFVSVLGSGAAGFAATRWLLDASLLTATFVGVAMTATSVGVSVGVWKESNRLKGDTGELLLDVVELDDISGVVLMSLLFGVAAQLGGNALSAADPQTLLLELGIVVGKLLAFFVACYLFMRYVERPFTRFVERTESGPEPMLTMVGVSFILASLAGLLGFSVAIGGFFAGVVFSQDREAVQMEASFHSLYELFVPFFFILIGLSIPLEAISGSLAPAGVLLAAAVLGKLLYSYLPARLVTQPSAALLIAVSMVPRAEITMIILQQGRSLDTVPLTPEIYNGMILVVLITVLLTPLVLRRLLVDRGSSDNSPVD